MIIRFQDNEAFEIRTEHIKGLIPQEQVFILHRDRGTPTVIFPLAGIKRIELENEEERKMVGLIQEAKSEKKENKNEK